MADLPPEDKSDDASESNKSNKLDSNNKVTDDLFYENPAHDERKLDEAEEQAKNASADFSKDGDLNSSIQQGSGSPIEHVNQEFADTNPVQSEHDPLADGDKQQQHSDINALDGNNQQGSLTNSAFELPEELQQLNLGGPSFAGDVSIETIDYNDLNSVSRFLNTLDDAPALETQLDDRLGKDRPETQLNEINEDAPTPEKPEADPTYSFNAYGALNTRISLDITDVLGSMQATGAPIYFYDIPLDAKLSAGDFYAIGDKLPSGSTATKNMWVVDYDDIKGLTVTRANGVVADFEATAFAATDKGLKPIYIDIDMPLPDELTLVSEFNDVWGVSGFTPIQGTGGRDLMHGTEEVDVFYAGNGNDELHGERGEDFLYGEDGHDYLFGGEGFDYLEGGAGNDYLNGGMDNDVIDGGDDNDAIIGGQGDDTLIGGDGDDRFLVSGREDGFDTVSGGDGYDTIEAYDAHTYYDPDAKEGEQGVEIDVSDDVIGLQSFSTEDSVEEIIGGAGHDIISGNEQDNTFDFTETKLTNIDAIQGGQGDDTITGSVDSDVIYGDEENPEKYILGENLFENGSFEFYSLTAEQRAELEEKGEVNVKDIAGWNVNQWNGVDVHQDGQAADGGSYVELDYAGNSLFGMVETAPGEKYLLTFDYSPTPGLSGENNKILIFTNDGAPIEIYLDGTDLTENQWQTFTLEVDASQYEDITRIEIMGNISEPDGQGGLIDNIKLQKIEGLNEQGGDDTLHGGLGEDTIYGQAGNDNLTGGENNDLLDGGEGLDRAHFSGSRDEYFISKGEDGEIYVRDKVADRDGTDTLVNIEELVFADGEVYTTEELFQFEVTYSDVINGGTNIDGLDGFVIPHNENGIFFIYNGDYGSDTDITSIESLGLSIVGLSDEWLMIGSDSRYFDNSTDEQQQWVFEEGAQADSFIYVEQEIVYHNPIAGDESTWYYTSLVAPELMIDPVTGQVQYGSNYPVTDIIIKAEQNGIVDLSAHTHIDLRITDEEFDSQIYGDDIKRGYIETGGGDDIVEISTARPGLFVDDDGGSDFEINTAAGNDTVVISVDNDDNQVADNFSTITIDTGTGDDRIDVLANTADEDQVTAVVSAGDGDDLINVATHSSRIDAGAGNDVVVTGIGNDVIDGGDGDDIVQSGTGNDTLNGGTGDDVLHSGAGNDTLIGGDGDDVIEAGSGNDTLNGGVGDDVLRGGAGDDTYIYTGQEDGFDTIVDDSGYDQIDGSNGDDTINLARVEGIEDIDGGHGNDTIQGHEGDTVLDFSNTDLKSIETIDGGAGNDTIIVDNHETMDGLTIIGGEGDDTLTGGDNNETFRYEGNDNGFDTLDGGDGDNTVSIEGTAGFNQFSNIDHFAGTEGSEDTIKMGDGDHVIDFSDTQISSIEKLDLGGGADVFHAHQDISYVEGGSGLDRIIFERPRDNYSFESNENREIVITDLETGHVTTTHSVEFLQFQDLTILMFEHAPEAYSVTQNGDQYTFTDTLNERTITFNIEDNLVLNFANPHTDDNYIEFDVEQLKVLTDGNDDLAINAASLVYGEAGHDVIQGSDDADYIVAGDGNDEFYGGAGDDYLIGGEGDDTVHYSSSQTQHGVTVDLVENKTTDDGFGNSDILSGIENVTASRHDDTIISGDGANRIDGRDGNDTVSYEKSDDGVTVDLSSSAAQSGGHADGDILNNIENVTGSVHNDTLTGDEQSNIINANDGDDVVYGSKGSDQLDGGAGDDTLSYENYGQGVNIDLSSGRVIKNPADSSEQSASNSEQPASNSELLDSNMEPLLSSDPSPDIIESGLPITSAPETGIPEDGIPEDGIPEDGIPEDGIPEDGIPENGIGLPGVIDLPDTVIPLVTTDIDQISNFENVRGSEYDDTIIGNDVNNQINAGAGDDKIYASAGQDFVDGGANSESGVDTLYFNGAVDDYQIIYNSDDQAYIITERANSENVTTATNIEHFNFDGQTNFLLPGRPEDFTATFSGNTYTFTHQTLGEFEVSVEGFEYITFIDPQSTDEHVSFSVNDIWTGTDGRDTILASELGGDLIYGNDDADSLDGLAGDDYLVGGQGNDTLTGHDGDDVLRGGVGDDVLNGGQGADYLDGGAGIDTATYHSSAEGVDVNLNTGIGHGGDAEGDRYESVENVQGSSHDDSITLNADDNIVVASDGDDTVYSGQGGNNIIVGGDGNDTVSYNKSEEGMDVDLSAGVATHQESDNGQDILLDVENVDGSSYDDHIKGDQQSNVINAGAGDDVIHGTAGDDHLDGGAGFDVVKIDDLRENFSIVMVVNGELTLTNKNTGDVTTIENIELIEFKTPEPTPDNPNPTPSTFDPNNPRGVDLMIFEQAPEAYALKVEGENYIFSDAATGEVVITLPSDGSETLQFLNNKDVNTPLEFSITDVFSITNSGSFNPTDGAQLIYTSGLGVNHSINVDAGDGDDYIVGGRGNDTMMGSAGADYFDGGEGIDQVNYQGDDDVIVNIGDEREIDGVTYAARTGQGGHAEEDTYNNVENIKGSDGDDVLIGNDGDNRIWTGQGSDTVYAGAGDDTIIGDFQNSSDTIYGEAGNDYIRGGRGADIIDGGDGDDTIDGHLGDDVISGGAGDDTIRLHGSLGSHTRNQDGIGLDSIDGGEGIDTIEFNRAPYSFETEFNFADGKLKITDKISLDENNNAGNNSITVENIEQLSFSWQEPADHGLTIAQSQNFNVDSNSDLPIEVDRIVFNDTPQAYTVEQTLVDGVKVLTFTNDDGQSLKFIATKDVVITLIDPEDTSSTISFTGDIIYASDAQQFSASNKDNLIYGGADDNTINGLAGDDYIIAGDGDDVLDGGAGADYLHGGDGSDTVNYQSSDAAVTVDLSTNEAQVSGGDAAGDRLNSIENIIGSSHDDVLTGNDQANDIDAGSGNDIIDGGAGDDLLKGDTGNDIIDGGLGNDMIYGGSGDDIIDGGAGDDSIYSGTDNDVIDGGAGNDTLYLEHSAGDYEVYWNESTAQTPAEIEFIYKVDDTILDTKTVVNVENFQFLGGESFSANVISSPTKIALNNNPEDYMMSLNADGVYTIADSDGNFVISFTDPDKKGEILFDNDLSFAMENIVVGADAEGTSAAELIYGSRSNDAVTGGSGDDYIVTGAGDDTLQGGAGSDTLFGGKGNDTLQGGDGSDTLFGGDGNDTLQGNTGDDVIDGGVGIDTVSYSDATSGVSVNLAEGTADDGMGGTDTLRNVENIIGSEYQDTLLGNSANNTINAGAGDDVIDAGAGNDSIYAGAGDDTIDAGVGDDYIDAGVGNDTINAGTGNDTINAGDGNDFIDAGAGNDTINAGVGDDVIDAGVGDDIINAGDGDDFINAGVGNDTINAGAGDDSIYGDAGNDKITGGAGNDVIDGGTGDDTIDGGDGRDTIDYSLSTSAVTVNLANGTADDGMGGTDTLLNVENIAGSRYNDTLLGSSINNYITAGAGDDVIDAGAGDDSIEAGVGDDLIEAGTGNDIIDAGDGDDTIDAGDGDDVIYAGAGNDSITAGAGNDSIEAGAGNDSINAGAGNDSINAGVGDDIINAGVGDDVIAAGAGDDTIIHANTETNFDSIDGEEGNDTLEAEGNIYVSELKNVEYINSATQGSTIQGSDTANTIDLSSSELTNIDKIDAGAGDDTVIGTNEADIIVGGLGADQIAGGDGDDLLIGSTYNVSNNTENLITGGSFELGDSYASGYHYLNEWNGWKSTRGMEFQHELTGFNSSDGDTHLEMDARSSNTTIYQDVQTQAGMEYNLTYDFGFKYGRADMWSSGIEVYVDGERLDYWNITGTGGYGIKWYSDGITFTAQDDNTRIEFRGVGTSDGRGSMMDNVKLVQTTTVDTTNTTGDTIDGGAGNDIIHGAAGNDTLTGGTGDDIIYGHDGDDKIYGNDGDDTVFVTGGINTIDTHNGDDTVHLQGGKNTVTLGDGDDIAYLGAGDDNVSGDAGSDTFYSDGQGVDVIDGGSSGDIPDTIIFDGGRKDYFITKNEDGTYVVNSDIDHELNNTTLSNIEKIEFADGGFIDLVNYPDIDPRVHATVDNSLITQYDNVDTVVLSGSAHEYQIYYDDYARSYVLKDMVANRDAFILINEQTVDHLQFADGANININQVKNDPGQYRIGYTAMVSDYGFSDNADVIIADYDDYAPTIYGQDGDDLIYGAQDGSHLEGDDGDDTLVGGDEGDRLYGGRDDDTLAGFGGDDRLYGETGNDRIFAGEGDDRIYAGDDDDLVYAGAGNDSIETGTGNDTVYAGSGDDEIILELENFRNSSTPHHNVISGDEGTDTLIIEDFEVFSYETFDITTITNDSGQSGYQITVNRDEDSAANIIDVFDVENIYVTTRTGYYSSDETYKLTVLDDTQDNAFALSAGNHVVYGGSGQDTLSLEEGVLAHMNELSDVRLSSPYNTNLIYLDLELGPAESPSDYRIVLKHIEKLDLGNGVQYEFFDKTDDNGTPDDSSDDVTETAYRTIVDAQVFSGGELDLPSRSQNYSYELNEETGEVSLVLYDDQVTIVQNATKINFSDGISIYPDANDQNYLIGDAGDNILLGGAGDDTLEATTGDDIYDGGSGNDTVVFHHNRNQYSIHVQDGEFASLGQSGDEVLKNIEFATYADGREIHFNNDNMTYREIIDGDKMGVSTFELPYDLEDTQIMYNPETDELIVRGGIGLNEGFYISNIDTLSFRDVDDIDIRNLEQRPLVDGLITLDIGYDNQIRIGTVGDDTLTVTSNTDTYAYEVIHTGDGNDTLTLDEFTDKRTEVYTGNGDDVINLQSVRDAKIDTGDGNDTINIQQTGDNVIDGGEGIDAARYQGSIFDFDFSDSSSRLYVTANNLQDEISIRTNSDDGVEYVQFDDLALNFNDTESSSYDLNVRIDDDFSSNSLSMDSSSRYYNDDIVAVTRGDDSTDALDISTGYGDDTVYLLQGGRGDTNNNGLSGSERSDIDTGAGSDTFVIDDDYDINGNAFHLDGGSGSWTDVIAMEGASFEAIANSNGQDWTVLIDGADAYSIHLTQGNATMGADGNLHLSSGAEGNIHGLEGSVNDNTTFSFENIEEIQGVDWTQTTNIT